MSWRRHRDDGRAGRRGDGAAHGGAAHGASLAAWLAAETADDDAAAETALASLFAALPPVAHPPGLAERVLAETVWAVEPTPAEVARGWWRAVGVLAGLAAVTVLAGGALAPSLVALLDPASALAGVFDGAVGLLAAFGGWLSTAARVADLVSWLGATTLLVASSPQMASALGAGAALVALAIKVLHQVLERDRRHSYAEAS